MRGLSITPPASYQRRRARHVARRRGARGRKSHPVWMMPGHPRIGHPPPLDEQPQRESGGRVSSAPKLGVWAWSFVGVVIATIIVFTAFAAVSEILLPLLFAAVLAVVFKPLVVNLERRGLKPTLGAGLVVSGFSPSWRWSWWPPCGGDRADGRDRRLGRRGDREGGRRARRRRGSAARMRNSGRGDVAGGRRGLRHEDRLGRRRADRPGERPDPRRADHVLPAEGRHEHPALRRRADRALGQGRGRQLPHRLVRDPPQLRKGPYRHVRDRLGRRRHRQLPARPSARVHDRRRELHRRLHPLHRRVPRRRAGRDRRLRRGRDRPGRA